jgi:hypothetical protein
VRIFEGILGIFQDAHFRKPCAPSKGVRTFGRAGLALHPVPLTRKVAQTPASASAGLALHPAPLTRKVAQTPASASAGLALHPVPLTRKVAQTPASASIASSRKEIHACVHHQVRRK